MHQLTLAAAHRPQLDGTVWETPHLGYFEVLETVTFAWVALLNQTGREDLSMAHFATVHIDADYRHEMFVGDLDTDTVLERIGRSSVTFVTSVAQNGRDTGIVRIVLVKVNDDRTAAEPLTDEQRQALQRLRVTPATARA